MFKPLKLLHKNLDNLIQTVHDADGSSRKVNFPVYRCFTTNQYVLYWEQKTRAQVLENQSDFFRDGHSGMYVMKWVNGRYVDGQGRSLNDPIRLHTDWHYDLFTRLPVDYQKIRGVIKSPWVDGDPYVTVAMESWANWSRPKRQQYLGRLGTGRYYSEAIMDTRLGVDIERDVLHEHERIHGELFHDYQRPMLKHLAFGNGDQTRKVISMGIRGMPEHDKIIDLGVNPFQGSDDRLQGGVKRGDMVAFSGGDNFAHMRAALRSSPVPMLISPYAGKYPNASPMLETMEDLERLDMMHAGLIPYPKLDVSMLKERTDTKGEYFIAPFGELPSVDEIRKHVAGLQYHLVDEANHIAGLAGVPDRIRMHVGDLDVNSSYWQNHFPSTDVMLNGGLSALADMFPPPLENKTMIVFDEVGPSENMQNLIDNVHKDIQKDFGVGHRIKVSPATTRRELDNLEGIEWVKNGPFDPSKVPDLVGMIAAEADLKELVGEPTQEELLDIKPVPTEEYALDKARFNAELPEHISPVTPLHNPSSHEELTQAIRDASNPDVAESYPKSYGIENVSVKPEDNKE